LHELIMLSWSSTKLSTTL